MDQHWTTQRSKLNWARRTKTNDNKFLYCVQSPPKDFAWPSWAAATQAQKSQSRPQACCWLMRRGPALARTYHIICSPKLQLHGIADENQLNARVPGCQNQKRSKESHFLIPTRLCVDCTLFPVRSALPLETQIRARSNLRLSHLSVTGSVTAVCHICLTHLSVTGWLWSDLTNLSGGQQALRLTSDMFQAQQHQSPTPDVRLRRILGQVWHELRRHAGGPVWHLKNQQRSCHGPTRPKSWRRNNFRAP